MLILKRKKRLNHLSSNLSEIPRILEARLLSRTIGKTFMLSNPRHIAVELTANCNLRCIMCSRSYDGGEAVANAGFMRGEIFRKISPFFSAARCVDLSGFGESLLHPEFLSMLQEAKATGARFTRIISNGHLLTQEKIHGLIDNGLDWLEVSIDAVSPQLYQKIRGSSVDSVINNLKLLRKIKALRKATKPELSLFFIGMKDNIHELLPLLKLAAEVGAKEVRVGNLMVHTPDLRNQNLFLHQDTAKKFFVPASKMAEEQNIALLLPSFNNDIRRCHLPFEALFITWNGLVLSCDFEKFLLGDLKKQSIQEIWNGPEAKNIRRRYFKEGLEKLCPNCTRWKNDVEAFLNPDTNNHYKTIRLKNQ